MARQSHDREDLLRDATAFVNRVQLRVLRGGDWREVFAGFRANGAASIYFDQDPVYHFNDRGELRRAFVDNSLIKAERGGLVVMRRQKDDVEVALLSSAMTDYEQRIFCNRVSHRLRELRQAIGTGDYAVVGQVCSEKNSEVVPRVVAFLEQLDEINIAASPRVTG